MKKYNEEYEMALISCIMQNLSIMCDVMLEMKEEFFYCLELKAIYIILLETFTEGKNYDRKVLTEKLNQKGITMTYEEVCSIEALGSSDYSFYIKELKDNFIYNQTVDFYQELGNFLKDHNGNEVQDFIQNKSLKVQSQGTVLSSGKSIMDELFNDLLNPESTKGVSTGFKGIDERTNGLQKGDLVIIGARPSLGKTSLALSMMINMLNKGTKVGFISLEMKNDAISRRLFSQVTSISYMDLLTKKFSKEDIEAIMSNFDKRIFDNLTIIHDNMDMNSIKTTARLLIHKKQIKVLFIDYIGLIDSSNSHKASWESMKDISRGLKALALELEIPIVAISQLNREAENKEADLSKISGSSSFEQDADLIMFIGRDRYKDEKVVLSIKKNRNGPTGDLKMDFIKDTMSFQELI